MRHRKLNWLLGYDSDLESKRESYFDELWQTDDSDERREMLRGASSLTALRSATFISSYEKALGIRYE